MRDVRDVREEGDTRAKFNSTAARGGECRHYLCWRAPAAAARNDTYLETLFTVLSPGTRNACEVALLNTNCALIAALVEHRKPGKVEGRKSGAILIRRR